MTTLPRQVEYALIALADMHGAHPEKVFSARGFCKKHVIPFDVMSKTMQRLTHAEILRSTQGIRGGYQIIRDLAKISLLELVEIMAAPIGVVVCLKERKVCQLEGDCNIVHGMTIFNQRIKNVYKSTNILELIGKDTHISVH